MVPLSSLLRMSQGFGLGMVMCYNGYTVVDTNDGPVPGFLLDQTQAAVGYITHEMLPEGVCFERTDLAY